MSNRSTPCSETIRRTRESIKAHWDVPTTAKRRISAVARQRELAERLGLRWRAIGGSDAAVKSCVA